MNITTATMDIGIRGTIVYVSGNPVTDEATAGVESVALEGLFPEKCSIVSISQIGMLKGAARITYTNTIPTDSSLYP